MGAYVRFGSKADMCGAKGHVRFTPNSGHVRCNSDVRFVPIADIAPLIRSPRRRGQALGGTVRPSALAVLRLIDQFVLGRRLHRHVGRLLTLENTIDVAGRAPVLVDEIRPIGDQAAAGDEEAGGVDRGQFVPGRKRDDQIAMNRRHRAPPSRSDRHLRCARRP